MAPYRCTTSTFRDFIRVTVLKLKFHLTRRRRGQGFRTHPQGHPCLMSHAIGYRPTSSIDVALCIPKSNLVELKWKGAHYWSMRLLATVHSGGQRTKATRYDTHKQVLKIEKHSKVSGMFQPVYAYSSIVTRHTLMYAQGSGHLALYLANKTASRIVATARDPAALYPRSPRAPNVLKLQALALDVNL
ncbi:hypothetical protein K504DRAFT_507494 [Pleomassaria siparia CBS 279.74]|uniref:Uncharacterized protein n=1 Tax=Pleomassaria siparia CBS 279.74 TaxID=1314801 RepID=A0A6G1JUS6_9PLEO|nr:hypothetical protein K504DRAFT_507494 [Pleomassaria siparia CBS 279.74]